TEIDSKPRLASSAVSAFSFMRGIGQPCVAPTSAAHHTGAEPPCSMVSKPAVDTNAAQHHVFSFPPQLVSMRLVGLRRLGTQGFGRSLAGARYLEPSSPQQVLE